MVSLRAGVAELKMNIERPTSNIQHRTKSRPAAGSMFGVRCSVFGVFLFLILSSRVHAADTNAVLTGWLAAQTNLRTWSADFTQTRTFKALTQPLIATGHISFGTPNKFRWELGRPAKTIALRDADEMFVIYPHLKRAERYPLGKAAPGEWRDMLSLLDAGFPRDRAAFDGQFRILSLTEANGSWLLGLQPTSAFARKMMKEIRVGLTTSDFSLTSSELVFIDGSRMRNDFTNAVMNPILDEKLFTWKPEADFKVTEPLAK